MKKALPMAQDAAEALAVQALTFLAADGERLGRFLALSGIGPAEIRAAASEPGFLAGVLEHLIADEALLTAFAAETGFEPTDTGQGARRARRRAMGARGAVNNQLVIPGRRQRVRAKRGPMTGSAANPESIPPVLRSMDFGSARFTRVPE